VNCLNMHLRVRVRLAQQGKEAPNSFEKFGKRARAGGNRKIRQDAARGVGTSGKVQRGPDAREEDD